MFDKELVIDIITTIEDVLLTINRRTSSITSTDDFLCSDTGMILLDSVCINLVAVGESVKNIDKITSKQLLIKYQSVNWKDVMGMRDIIVHHYFDIDADEIYKTLKEDIPSLLNVLREIRLNLQSNL